MEHDEQQHDGLAGRSHLDLLGLASVCYWLCSGSARC